MPASDRPTRLTDGVILEKFGSLQDWSLSDDHRVLTRHLTFKGFAKATYAANLAIWLADATNHHPDIQLGWGYCRVSFTTHDVDGLTELDFDCARRFDALLASGK